MFCATISTETLRALCLTVNTFFSMTCWEKLDYLIVTGCFYFDGTGKVFWSNGVKTDLTLPCFETYIPVLQRLLKNHPNLKLVFEVGPGSFTPFVEGAKTKNGYKAFQALQEAVKLVGKVVENGGVNLVVNSRESLTLSGEFVDALHWCEKEVDSIWLKYDSKWKNLNSREFQLFDYFLINTNFLTKYEDKSGYNCQGSSVMLFGLDNGHDLIHQKMSELSGRAPLAKVMFEHDTQVLVQKPYRGPKFEMKYVETFYTVSYQAACNTVFQHENGLAVEPVSIDVVERVNDTQGHGYLLNNGDLLCFEDEAYLKGKLADLKNFGQNAGLVVGDIGYDCYSTLLYEPAPTAAKRAYESVFNTCWSFLSADVPNVQDGTDEQSEKCEKPSNDVQDTTNDQNKIGKTALVM